MGIQTSDRVQVAGWTMRHPDLFVEFSAQVVIAISHALLCQSPASLPRAFMTRARDGVKTSVHAIDDRTTDRGSGRISDLDRTYLSGASYAGHHCYNYALVSFVSGNVFPRMSTMQLRGLISPKERLFRWIDCN